MLRPRPVSVQSLAHRELLDPLMPATVAGLGDGHHGGHDPFGPVEPVQGVGVDRLGGPAGVGQLTFGGL